MDAGSPAPLSVSVRRGEECTVIAIRGEVDLFGLPTVRRAVGESAAPSRAVTVDLSDVTFIDSAGVEYLLELSQAAHQRGAAFQLGQPSARVSRVIDLLGVHDQLR